MTGVAAYMRCSGASQVSGDTWERQLEAIRACCKAKGFEIVHEYRDEGVSGKLGEESRPAFQEMVADLLGNGCRTIVIEGMDRLARQYDVQQTLTTYLASKDLTLISANTGEDITAALMGDPMRRALVQIQGILSELEKNMLVAKLRKARERIRNQGKKCDGRKSYGEKSGEGPILERMRIMKSQKATSTVIAETLNHDGVLSRYGKLWKSSVVSKILAREAQKVA